MNPGQKLKKERFQPGELRRKNGKVLCKKTGNGNPDDLSGSLSDIPADECCTWKPMAQ